MAGVSKARVGISARMVTGAAILAAVFFFLFPKFADYGEAIEQIKEMEIYFQKQKEEQIAHQREEESKKNSLKRNESAEKIIWKNMDGKLLELFNILDVNQDS